MFKKIRKYWRAFVFPETVSLSTEGRRRILLTNQVSFILFMVCAPYTLVFNALKLPLHAALIVPISISFLVPIFLNYFKKYVFSRQFFIFSCNMAAFYYAASLGKDTGIWTLYFAFLGFPLILFEKTDSKEFLFCILLPIVCFIGLAINYFVYPFIQIQFLAQQTTTIVFLSACVTVCIIVVLFQKFYRSSNEEYLRQLKESNDQLTLVVQKLKSTNALIKSLSQQAALGAIVRGLSHEIKNPLASIQACCNLILDSEPNEKIKDRVEGILHNVQNLGELTYTLLRDAGAIVWADKSLDIFKILDQVLRLIDDEAFYRKISIKKHLQPLPIIRGSSAYVAQALLNIFVNALRYTPEGGVITIHAWSDQHFIIIEVEDTGVGIDESIKDKIFEAEISSEIGEDSSHVGLGLYFVKQVMDSHQGTVSAEALTQGGSRFTLKFPLVRNE